MGLLDLLGNDDTRTALGLLAAAGPSATPQSLGQRVMGGLLQSEDIKQRQMQQKMQEMQMQQMQQKMALLAPILGAMSWQQSPGVMSQQSAPPPMAQAPQSAPQSAPQFNAEAYARATPEQRQSFLQSMPLESVAAMKLAGVADLTNDWKLAHEGFERKAGSVYEMPDGRQISVPSVSQDGKASQLIPDANAPGGYRVIAPQGAVDTFTQYTKAGEGAKAAYDLVDWTNPTDGQVYKVTRDQLAQLASAPRGAMSPKVSAAMNADAQSGPVTFNIGGQRGVLGQGSTMQPSPIGIGVASGQTPTQLSTQAADKEAQTTAAKNAADYENNLNAKVVAGRELVRRVNEQEQLLNQFRTGATAPVRSKVALMAKDMGAPDELVKRIAGGDPAAAQEFTKFAAQTNLEQLKQAIGANRMLKTEFDAFQEANPSIASDPNAVRKVFGWLRDTYSRDYAEQQALAGYKKQGLPLSDFPAWYSSQQHDALMSDSKKATTPIVTHRYNPQTGKIEAVQ